MKIFWKRLHRSERGTSLVELIVTVSILSMVLGFVLQTFVSVQNAATGANLRLQNLEEARILMDTVSKDIRTAARMTAITSPFDVSGVPAGYGFGNAPPYAGKTEVWFYANLTLSATPSPCPDIIHLYVDSSVTPPVLREQTLPADTTGTPTPPNCAYTGAYSTRLVGKYIANPATSPVFTYFQDDVNGNPVAMASTLSPLSAANRALVNAIGITLSIRQSTNYTVPFTTLTNRVRLANVDYNPLPSP
jgi:type II secretory pathway pseudopilin PulG